MNADTLPVYICKYVWIDEWMLIYYLFIYVCVWIDDWYIDVEESDLVIRDVFLDKLISSVNYKCLILHQFLELGFWNIIDYYRINQLILVFFLKKLIRI